MESLAQAVSTLIGNPFEVDDVVHRRARAEVRAGRFRDELTKCVAANELAAAERLVLARGHAEALDGLAATEVLASGTLPARLLGRLPRSRGAYLRIVTAAARSCRALTAMQGTSPAINEVRRKTWAACFGSSLHHAFHLERVIRDHDVLILGETGTGKELVAHAIQEAAPGRADGARAPRAAVNAAAIPETLIESELFGHVKGAFTGAADHRRGRIRTADGGCFFLDEVGDLRLTTQVKLLRVMENDLVQPVGSDDTEAVDVRFLAATHKDLDKLAETGRFRQDLYQRLAGIVIRLPPLRERSEDIPAIGRDFALRFLPDEDLRARLLPPLEGWLESLSAQTAAWPGNVRQLQNALRNLLLGLDAEPGMPFRASCDANLEIPRAIRDCAASLRDVTDWYVARVLAHTKGNLAQTSRILEVDRTTVRRRARTNKRSR